MPDYPESNVEARIKKGEGETPERSCARRLATGSLSSIRTAGWRQVERSHGRQKQMDAFVTLRLIEAIQFHSHEIASVLRTSQ